MAQGKVTVDELWGWIYNLHLDWMEDKSSDLREEICTAYKELERAVRREAIVDIKTKFGLRHKDGHRLDRFKDYEINAKELNDYLDSLAKEL